MSEKKCNGCGRTQPAEVFSPREKNGKLTLRARCRKCESDSAAQWRKRNPEKTAEQKTLYYARNPRARMEEQYRRRARWWGYDPQSVLDFVAYHGNVCDCCGQLSAAALHLDHDHATNEIRGLLCNGCNTGIGQFKDDIGRLQKAIDYLQMSQRPLKR